MSYRVEQLELEVERARKQLEWNNHEAKKTSLVARNARAQIIELDRCGQEIQRRFTQLEFELKRKDNVIQYSEKLHAKAKQDLKLQVRDCRVELSYRCSKLESSGSVYAVEETPFDPKATEIDVLKLGKAVESNLSYAMDSLLEKMKDQSELQLRRAHQLVGSKEWISFDDTMKLLDAKLCDVTSSDELETQKVLITQLEKNISTLEASNLELEQLLENYEEGLTEELEQSLCEGFEYSI